jgi:hypothetical protein
MKMSFCIPLATAAAFSFQNDAASRAPGDATSGAPSPANVEGGRGRLQRQSALDRALQREPTSQSELGVSVQIHPPSFERESGKTHSLKGGAG